MSSQKLMSALQSGNVSSVKKIVTSKGFDGKKSLLPPGHPYKHYPAVVAAVETGNVEIVRLLLDNGCLVDDAVGINGITGLYVACQEVYSIYIMYHQRKLSLECRVSKICANCLFQRGPTST